MDELVNRVQEALFQLKKNFESSHVITGETPITKPQMYLLFAISKRGSCKLTQLAEMMDVKPSAITVMIDRLEKQDLVKRVNDPTDRRSILVELTPLSSQVLEAARKKRNEMMKNYLSRLEPEECNQFIRLLEKITYQGQRLELEE